MIGSFIGRGKGVFFGCEPNFFPSSSLGGTLLSDPFVGIDTSYSFLTNYN